MQSPSLGLGKVPAPMLGELLERFGARSRRVLTPPAPGEDAAAVLSRLPCTVTAMNPVIDEVERLGHEVVHRNANAVATRGADPSWFLFTLLLPPQSADPSAIEAVFHQVSDACLAVGAELIGGHTEVTEQVTQPVAVGTMIGEITTFRLTATRSARQGNAIVMIGACGEYGTGLLAQRHSAALERHGVPATVVEQARAFLEPARRSIVPAVRVAMAQGHPHAMHDLTDGGLVASLHDLARLAEVGVEIDESAVPVRPETQAICTSLGLDPWRLLSFGTLLLCVDEIDVEALLQACSAAAIEAFHVGRVVSPELGLHRVSANGTRTEIAACHQDELHRFEQGQRPH
ncbi:MAG: hypothetical protein EB084_12475 [Proteobacteria bacterium]|nr:hypothetical protein [Pseudomonadota bacterium]